MEHVKSKNVDSSKVKREDIQKITNTPSIEQNVSPEKTEHERYVKNSSFLSNDIEAQKIKTELPNTSTIKKVRIEKTPSTQVNTTPPMLSFKVNKTNKKAVVSVSSPKEIIKQASNVTKDVKSDKLAQCTAPNDISKAVDNDNIKKVEKEVVHDKIIIEENKTKNESVKNEESNGVGDKIKKFEKAAEVAVSNPGKLSRPGSVRGRNRTDTIGSESREEVSPIIPTQNEDSHKNHCTDVSNSTPCLQSSLGKSSAGNISSVKWQKSKDEYYPSDSEKVIKKPEPQKIIKPEFKQLQSPVDATIRSPSLGAKMSDQFPSHGTAFRNVLSPIETARNEQSHREVHKFNDDVNTQNNFKSCKVKAKEKSYSVSKGSSYFTRGSEEIWLVKKKDIEEIEERVLDSFRRAGGNVSTRGETRPSSDSGQGTSFSHATMGRNKRPLYARSESLDPQWAGSRAQTLKRQTSVACTCGHDKKPRAKSAGADATARARSRSHGDDSAQAVLDKYETLV